MQLAITLAEQSPCKLRKVGAVVVAAKTNVYSEGYNNNGTLSCEVWSDAQNCLVTDRNTQHAEIAALEAFKSEHPAYAPATIYVTHPPCQACATTIEQAGIKSVVVVDTFMKFSSKKLRYDLIPPSATKGLARVLTYGARKYKPENWRGGKPSDYVAAAMRHFEAYRSGEARDEESGELHLDHLLTNIAFLIELDPECETQDKELL